MIDVLGWFVLIALAAIFGVAFYSAAFLWTEMWNDDRRP